MSIGTPQARAKRVTFLVFAALALITATLIGTPARAQSPTEGTIRLIPAMSDVPGDAGPFTVYVVAQDLQHNGTIQYDDNRDGTPDRSVPSDGVAAFEVEVDYNPAVLSLGGVQAGPELGRTGRTFQCLPPDRKPGSISFGCVSSGNAPPGVSGTLTLASVQFVPQAAGLSPLALNADLAGPLGDAVNVTVNGGAARVFGTVLAATEPDGSPVPASSPGAESSPAAGGPTTSSEPTSPALRTGVSIETATAQAVLTRTSGAPSTPTPTVQRGPASPTGQGGSGGDGFGGATLWSAIVAGSVGAGGLLTLGAMVWRQRQHRPQI